jgi:hypothetical protein
MKRGRAFSETKNLLLDFSRSKLSAATCPGRQLRIAWPPTRTSGARSNRNPLYVPTPALSTPRRRHRFAAPWAGSTGREACSRSAILRGDSGRCQRWARSEDDTGRRWAAILPTRRGTLFLTSGAAETATGCDQRRPAALELGSAGEWARRRAPARTRRSDG